MFMAVIPCILFVSHAACRNDKNYWFGSGPGGFISFWFGSGSTQSLSESLSVDNQARNCGSGVLLR